MAGSLKKIRCGWRGFCVRKPSGAEVSLNFETITMKPNRGRKKVDSAKDGSKFYRDWEAEAINGEERSFLDLWFMALFFGGGE